MVKIGMLDSGVGGLTIVKAVHQSFPHVDISFVGDNLRAPYGSRPQAEIKSLSEQMIRFLNQQQVDMIVIACNTISALDLSSIERKYNIPLLGIIQPTARLAQQISSCQQIALIATEQTVQSQAYQKHLSGLNPHKEIIDLATPSLVPLVENNLMGTEQAKKELASVLSYFDGKDFDTMILACTHYPFLKNEIQSVLADGTSIIDASMAICHSLNGILVGKQQASGQIELFTTAHLDQFESIAQPFFKTIPYTLKQIKL